MGRGRLLHASQLCLGLDAFSETIKVMDSLKDVFPNELVSVGCGPRRDTSAADESLPIVFRVAGNLAGGIFCLQCLRRDNVGFAQYGVERIVVKLGSQIDLNLSFGQQSNAGLQHYESYVQTSHHSCAWSCFECP